MFRYLASSACRWTTLIALTLAATGCAGEAADSELDTEAAESAVSARTEYAPYFYTWGWGSNSYAFKNLVDLKSKAGLEGVTLAFVLSDGGCRASRDIQDNMGDVKAFREKGGHLKASFGGASGKYLDAACGSAGALARAIGSFVDETGITDLDFDVEQAPVMTSAVNRKRGEALKMLQDQKNIKVSFTLPVMPSGMDATALDVIQKAALAGVTISHVNLMVMDYGSSFRGSMSRYAEQSLTSANAQLRRILPGVSEARAWTMLGATPMIGKNDEASEVFKLSDAKALVDFARQKHLGLLSFWAINRDQKGSGIEDHSGVNTASFQFNDIFKTAQ